MRGMAIDITARKQAEALAAESVARFRRLADALPEKIFTATPDGETDYLNQQWSIYTGLPLHEVLRLGWRQFVHPDDLEEKVNRWNQHSKPELLRIRTSLSGADGAYRWHLSRAQPMRRSDGTVSMWVGSNTDVDDLKRAQFDLRQSEGRCRLAMEAAGLAFGIGLSAKMVKWSPEHNRMLGIPPDIHEGSCELFISYIHASDREAVRRSNAKEQRVDFEGEFRSSGIDGEIRWLSGHGRAYYDEQTGRPVRMIGVIATSPNARDSKSSCGRISNSSSPRSPQRSWRENKPKLPDARRISFCGPQPRAADAANAGADGCLGDQFRRRPFRRCARCARHDPAQHQGRSAPH